MSNKDDRFRKGLEELINAYSMENGSDTPDFILAEYLLGCLKVFNETTVKRENWYSRPTEHLLGEVGE